MSTLNPYDWRPSEDELFRFIDQDLDWANIRHLLRSVVDGDVLYLDDPHGFMVGYVLSGCHDTLLANLNVGLDPDTADPGPWLCHENLDWIEPECYGAPPGGNLITLLEHIAKDDLAGLVDEGAGGLVGYIYADRVDEVKRVLNHTGDPTGVFGKISQITGGIYPTAEWDRDGDKPKATHWYWSVGNQWVAVVDAWETAWWDGADDEAIAARPDPWQHPIWRLPPDGILIFQSADDEHTIELGPRPRSEAPRHVLDSDGAGGGIPVTIVADLGRYVRVKAPPGHFNHDEDELDVERERLSPDVVADTVEGHRKVWTVPVLLHVPASDAGEAVRQVHEALDNDGSVDMPVTVNGLEIVYVTAPDEPDDMSGFDRVSHAYNLPE